MKTRYTKLTIIDIRVHIDMASPIALVLICEWMGDSWNWNKFHIFIANKMNIDLYIIVWMFVIEFEKCAMYYAHYAHIHTCLKHPPRKEYIKLHVQSWILLFFLASEIWFQTKWHKCATVEPFILGVLFCVCPFCTLNLCWENFDAVLRNDTYQFCISSVSAIQDY